MWVELVAAGKMRRKDYLKEPAFCYACFTRAWMRSNRSSNLKGLPI
jgi:hypothetical protein